MLVECTFDVPSPSPPRSSGDQSLDVEGLKEFLKQVDILPCRVPEADLLQVSTRTCVSAVLIEVKIKLKLPCSQLSHCLPFRPTSWLYSISPSPNCPSPIQERLQEVESFQHDASEELSLVSQAADNLQTRPISHLEQLIQRGEQLEVAMPELDAVRTVSVGAGGGST